MFASTLASIAALVRQFFVLSAVALAVAGSGQAAAQAPAKAPAKAPILATESGRVAGAQRDGATVYWNIPFAAAERWQAPVRAPRWQGVRAEKGPGPICPQADQGQSKGLPQSENCLSLNVWTPAARPARPLPVMVWIHGGNFRSGGGGLPIYDGPQIAGRDVVLVTINYRLGLLGRFAHPDLSKEQAGGPRANYGLMDQIAALQWVKRNIGRFGGDPDNVTIFGYSAGGVAVNYLMAAPSVHGLFHKAISQSGGLQIETTRHISAPRPGILGTPLEKEGEATAKHFGGEAGPATLAALRALPAADLIAYQEKTLIGSLNPVVDGVLIPDDIGRTFRDGRQAPVPYMAGSTSWEASLLHYTATPIPPRMVLSGIADLDAAREAFGNPDDAAMAHAWFADSVFLGTAHYLSEASAKRGHPAWLYLFDHLPAALRGTVPGVAHGDEVPYIFGTLPGKMRGVTKDQIGEEERQVSAMMTGYWTNFARSGDPNGAGLPRLAPRRPGDFTMNRLARTAGPVPDFMARKMAYLDGYYAARMDLSK